MILLLLASLTAQIPPAEGTPSERAVFRTLDLRVGDGPAAEPGQEYTVHYTGWLQDGKKFDSSVDRNVPLTFIQGRRQVIAGWDAGFEGMRVGGRRRLIIPYQMAYGEKGRGPIPPRAELTFDVELLGVRNMPEEKPSIAVVGALDAVHKKVLALAKAIPAGQYGYRPVEGVRPVREVIAHLAYGTTLMTDLAEKVPDPAAFKTRVEEQWKNEKAPRTKDEAIALLEDNFAKVRARLEPLRAAQLNRETTFFGERTTTEGVLIRMLNHSSEHLGQLIAYARAAGIALPQ